MGSVIFMSGDSSKEVNLKDINSVEDVASNMKEVMNNNYMECEDSEGNEISMDVAKTIEANKGLLEQMELRQEEINHPEKTVHGRAFIKNFDD